MQTDARAQESPGNAARLGCIASPRSCRRASRNKSDTRNAAKTAASVAANTTTQETAVEAGVIDLTFLSVRMGGDSAAAAHHVVSVGVEPSLGVDGFRVPGMDGLVPHEEMPGRKCRAADHRGQ